MKLHRTSGVLLHPTSLPGPHGIGDLGAEAFRFIDFLADAGQGVWQILPLGPTGYGDSPYSAFSAFAGNPLLVCLERLAEAGDLEAGEIAGVAVPEGKANYGFAQGLKERLLARAARRFRDQASAGRREAFERFCADQASWLDDYALFRELRRHFEEQSWQSWPEPVRRRDEGALRFWGEELADAVHAQKYAQFVFFEQWWALREYANARGIRVFGDMPIFVALDSADVWAHQELFQLDPDGRPTRVAGVPPDYFSATGQRWGNPLYRWERLAEEGFSWWLDRVRWSLAQADWVRIDHFRGFQACWSIPSEEETAVNGFWEEVPGERLFETLIDRLGEVPVIAEDLGLITEEVEALRDRFALPGMKVLQFAFGSGADNPYLPHNLPRHCVVYTGTHDNDTTLGWWRSLLSEDREAVRSYLGHGCRQMPWDLVRAAFATVAEVAIVPLQDLLGLESAARMNRPGHGEGNWCWRFHRQDLSAEVRDELAGLARLYGRSPAGS